MTSQRPSETRINGRSLVIGAFVLLAGLASMAGVVFTLYSGSIEAWQIGYRLGLPGTLLASAVAQLMTLIGGWMVWRAFPN